MPEFLERRFSPAARWVLSLISLVAYVLTKIAVGHLRRRRRVRRAAARARTSTIAGTTFNSFWVGSVLVVVLTGLYTVVGGMRAVAYTEAVQTFILVVGSLLLTVFGLTGSAAGASSARRCRPRCSTSGSRSIPAGVEGTWAPVKEAGRMAWYFNTNYPWLGMLFCAPIIGLWYWCTDQYIVQRTLGAPNETRGAARHDLRRVPEAAAGLHLHHPRHDRAGAGQDRQGAGAGDDGGRGRQGGAAQPRRPRSR